MSQNLASNHFDDAQWAQVDQGLDVLETAIEPMLVALNGPGVRRRLVKMGDGSEAFCRKTHDAMNTNRHLLPSTFDLEEMARDIKSHDALGIRLARMAQLMEKMRDTDMALGSDVMVIALAGYQLLKIAGKGEGLDAVSRDMGKRFEGNGTRSNPQAPQA
ncbi:hypothetical protein [Lysobacter fragariae]